MRPSLCSRSAERSSSLRGTETAQQRFLGRRARICLAMSAAELDGLVQLLHATRSCLAKATETSSEGCRTTMHPGSLFERWSRSCRQPNATDLSFSSVICLHPDPLCSVGLAAPTRCCLPAPRPSEPTHLKPPVPQVSEPDALARSMREGAAGKRSSEL